MKRLFVIPLVGVMLAILAVPALAEENAKTIQEDGGVADIAVKATYESSNTAAEVYSVDISWGNMHAIYAPNRTQVWNPSTRQYESTGEGVNPWGWKSSTINELKANQVKIVNRSNTVIACNLEFKPSEDFKDTLLGSFNDNGTCTLPSASSDATLDGLSRSFFLTLSGTITNSTDGNVGIIAVSIARDSYD